MKAKKHNCYEVHYCQFPHRPVRELKDGDIAHVIIRRDGEGKMDIVICEECLVPGMEIRRTMTVSRKQETKTEKDPSGRELKRMEQTIG